MKPIRVERVFVYLFIFLGLLMINLTEAPKTYAAAYTTVRFDPSSKSVKHGETFAIDAVVDPVDPANPSNYNDITAAEVILILIPASFRQQTSAFLLVHGIPWFLPK